MAQESESPQAGPEGPPAEAATSFMLLCGSLGAQVQMALGMLPDPTDGKVRFEAAAARQGIDMLAMLEEKTRGNLEDREAKLLTALLTHLRMLFVERAKAASAEEASDDAGDGPTIVTP